MGMSMKPDPVFSVEDPLYPSYDGLPLAENDWQLKAILEAFNALNLRYLDRPDVMHSEVLGLDVRVERQLLRFRDSTTGEYLQNLAEATATLTEKTAVLSETTEALSETTEALSETTEALTEKTAALAEEKAARRAAEARIAELEARLRGP